MLKVLIVDDELLMRKGIQSLIDWGKEGFEICGEAKDGREALELIRETQPDLVFTDIVMPQMGGLQLIKEALKEFPDTRFVVLSCHNDYEFVREALTLGARDYILKLSMLPKDLLEILHKLSREIYAQKNVLLPQKISCEEIMSVLKAVLFERDMEREKLIDEYFGEIPYYVVYLRLFAEGSDSYHGKGVGKFLKSNILDSRSVLLKRDDTTFIALTSRDFATIKEACQKYKDAFMAQFGYRMMGGVSGQSSEENPVVKLYEQSRDAYDRGFYEGYGVYSYQSRYFSHALTGNQIAVIINRMGEHLSECDYDRASEVLEYLFEEVRQAKLVPEEVLAICFEIYLRYQKVLYEKLNDKTFPLKKSGFQETVRAMGTLEEIKLHLLHIARNMVENFTFFQNRVIKSEISAVLQYIASHMDQDISLKSAACYVNLSESYLSHLFKREIRESFSDYLQKKRMEQAKMLLGGSTERVTVIASRCGYEEYSYFCRVFKKSTGQTPNEYRRKHKNNE